MTVNKLKRPLLFSLLENTDAVTVIPDQFNRFKNVFGNSEDTISRLNSLRKFVYDQDEDGLISAKIGYRLDMSMNTTCKFTPIYIQLLKLIYACIITRCSLRSPTRPLPVVPPHAFHALHVRRPRGDHP